LAPYLDLPFLASLADSGHVFCVSCDNIVTTGKTHAELAA
jgi:hypothetical protein